MPVCSMMNTALGDALMRRGVAVALLGLLALGAGCATTAATTSLAYAPTGTRAPRSIARSLAVVPFGEARDARPLPDPRLILLVFIPLVPYVTFESEPRIDQRYVSGMRQRGGSATASDLFPFAMAQAVAGDLDASGMFENVAFVTERSDADYELGGTLRSTRYDLTATTYLLGAPGFLMWFTGLPYGRVSVDLELDLLLRDRTGAVVWQYPLRGRSGALLTALNPSGADFGTGYEQIRIPRYGSNEKGIDGDSAWAYHADALRSGMEEAKASLAAVLAERAASAR